MTDKAAIGYALKAAERMGLIKIGSMKASQFQVTMMKEMDLTTGEEAEEIYRKN